MTTYDWGLSFPTTLSLDNSLRPHMIKLLISPGDCHISEGKIGKKQTITLKRTRPYASQKLQNEISEKSCD